MSVDYGTCDNCGETFIKHDGEGDVWCSECGICWCSDECADLGGVIRSTDDDLADDESYDGDFDIISCKYCRKENYTDDVILDKALKLLGKTRQEIVNIINKGEN